MASGAPQTRLGAERVVVPSKRFYGTLRAADGSRRQIPLCEDREASKTLLRRLQTEEDRRLAVGYDRWAVERQRPLEDLVSEYEQYLRSKANTNRHVALTIRRINTLLEATKAKTLRDVEASRISAVLALWRQRKKTPLSVSTTNHYARAIKGFTRWLWTERRTPDDPLTPLRLLNANGDRRHVRRASRPMSYSGSFGQRRQAARVYEG